MKSKSRGRKRKNSISNSRTSRQKNARALIERLETRQLLSGIPVGTLGPPLNYGPQECDCTGQININGIAEVGVPGISTSSGPGFSNSLEIGNYNLTSNASGYSAYNGALPVSYAMEQRWV